MPEFPTNFRISDFLKVYPMKLESYDANICNMERNFNSNSNHIKRSHEHRTPDRLNLSQELQFIVIERTLKMINKSTMEDERK